MSFDFLMVGLGNPGSEYAHHRHNIGFMAADALAQRWQAKAWQKKYQGLITDIILPTADGPQRVLLLKPQTFMNLWGQSVQAAAAFYKTPVEKIFVLHDEIELIPARVRIKQGGGHAGHNGLKSVDACVGQNYWRVRLGVGRPPVAEDVSAYVLSNFAKADAAWLDPLLTTLADDAPLLLGREKDHAALLNKLTLAAQPQPPSPP